MQLFIERLFYFRASITSIGLLFVVLVWAISTVIYVASISLFVAIVAAAFYYLYWANRNN